MQRAKALWCAPLLSTALSRGAGNKAQVKGRWLYSRGKFTSRPLTKVQARSSVLQVLCVNRLRVWESGNLGPGPRNALAKGPGASRWPSLAIHLSGVKWGIGLKKKNLYEISWLQTTFFTPKWISLSGSLSFWRQVRAFSGGPTHPCQHLPPRCGRTL